MPSSTRELSSDTIQNTISTGHSIWVCEALCRIRLECWRNFLRSPRRWPPAGVVNFWLWVGSARNFRTAKRTWTFVSQCDGYLVCDPFRLTMSPVYTMKALLDV